MSVAKSEPLWQRRLKNIKTNVDTIRFATDHDLAQNQEWCEVIFKNGTRRRYLFHNYAEVYRTPGLYEKLFYERLRCSSPSRTVRLLEELVHDFELPMEGLRVLDVGAGNGMVGDELRVRRVRTIVGVDIIPEAKEATNRDRPGVYNEYFVTDLTDLPEHLEKRLREYNFNCLTTVAALGFGDIPPAAFIKALDLIETPGWVAFTIKEDFLHERDSSGFSKLIRYLNKNELMQVQAYRRYRHRYSMTGKPLYYVIMVARKLRDVPDQLFPDVLDLR
ncbi:MAG: hypothetical protein KatS3mg105_2492 [Gemmatales bacterium]|nr:MAG: hypothetical protein KatS3mg105_2492 [Gemmatales bacterium]